jgi:hypothetical protein
MVYLVLIGQSSRACMFSNDMPALNVLDSSGFYCGSILASRMALAHLAVSNFER